ncbi:hypothetical protein M0804_006050 [Polistes exclamans]|nr:hypothetical protein M0804_006050 [Polistes exclamans]
MSAQFQLLVLRGSGGEVVVVVEGWLREKERSHDCFRYSPTERTNDYGNDSRRDYNASWKTVLVLAPAIVIVSSMQLTSFLPTTILIHYGLFLFSFSSRTKAILLYPSGSVFQITLGASIPVRSNKRGSVVFSSGFQYNYYLPSNVSDFESTIVLSRHIRDLDLRDTYTRIEHFLEEIERKADKMVRFAFDVLTKLVLLASIGSWKDQRSQRSKEEEIQVWRLGYTGNNGHHRRQRQRRRRFSSMIKL